MKAIYYNVSFRNQNFYDTTRYKLLRETKTKLFLKAENSCFILRVSKRTLKTRLFAKDYSFESASVLEYSKI